MPKLKLALSTRNHEAKSENLVFIVVNDDGTPVAGQQRVTLNAPEDVVDLGNLAPNVLYELKLVPAAK